MNASTKPKYSAGHVAAMKIATHWPHSPFVGDAVAAAYSFGLLVSCGMLMPDDAERSLKVNASGRKVDEKHWSAIFQSFLNGRDSLITSGGESFGKFHR